MQILNINRKEGVIRLRPETLDDLWHLDKILEEGDIVKARTFRKTQIKSGSEIREGDKVPLTLAIRLEKKEFHGDARALRLTGKIVQGPEDRVRIGSYHTISVEVRTELTVKKEWLPFQLERLKRAREKKPLLLVCVLDREQADFALLKESGIEYLASIKSRKSRGGELEGYHEEILEYLKEKQDRVRVIIVAGPGFERENLAEFIKERDPELGKKVFAEHANSAGRAGINEVVKSSANRVLKESRIARESEFVERLLAEIRKDGMAVYGKRETEDAVSHGAVEILLVSEKSMKEFDYLMRAADKTGAKIAVISSDHEAGERFLSLGGIGGILRYKP